MQQKLIVPSLALLLICSLASGPTASPSTANPEEAIPVIQKMLASIRLKKFDRALSYIDIKGISTYLLDEHYDKLTPEQQKKFQGLLADYITYKSFPLAIKYIGDIGLTFDQPVMQGGLVYLKSSIVYSKSERMVFSWVLTPGPDGLKVSDFLDIQNKSSLQKSRDRQIIPIFEKHGAKGFLDRFEKAIKKLRS